MNFLLDLWQANQGILSAGGIVLAVAAVMTLKNPDKV
jgi:hypothetical protein